MYECIINGIPARVECQIEFVCLYEELLVLVENYVEREDDELRPRVEDVQFSPERRGCS